MRLSGGLALITVLAAAAAGKEVREREAAVGALRPQQARVGYGPAADSMTATVYPVVLGAPFTRVQHGGGSVPDAETVRAAYESRLGSQVVDADAKWQFEDLVLEALDGCPLSYYEFDLAGQLWAEQELGPFTVEFGLYRGCDLFAESAAEGLIAGTGGAVTFTESGPTTVVVVPQQQVLLPGVVWLGVRFSRGSAGLIAGGAPEVGHSTWGVGWARVGSCFRGNLGYTESGTIHPFYNVRLFVPASCPKAHPVYANSRSGLCDHGQDSAGEWLVDDALLEGGGCLMRAYEYTVMEPGVYDTELRTACDGPAIAGTQRSEFVKAPGQTRVRHTFNPPIPIPQQVWIAGRNLPEAGSFGLAGSPPIGATNSGLCLPESTSSLGLAVSIYCDGEPPVGACCDMHQTQCDGGDNGGGRCETDEHCPGGQCATRCREVIRANCPYEGRYATNLPEWEANAVCDPDPFKETCGVAACCTPLYGCLDLTHEECNAVAPLGATAYWDRSRLCAIEPYCYPPACIGSDESCTVTHDGAGCKSRSCCGPVCAADPWCCQVEWDRGCLEIVTQVCSNIAEHVSCRAPYEPLDLEVNSSVAIAKVSTEVVRITTCAKTCDGGERTGEYCVADSDCLPDGFCRPYGMLMYDPTWVRFTPAGSSVRLGTCAGDGDGNTAIVLYKPADVTSPTAACNSVVSQACAFNEGCETNRNHSCVCFSELVPGETYYAVIASRAPQTGRITRLDISSPCQASSCGPPNDCNANGTNDVLDVVSGPSLDCQRNLIPDECELGAPGDCNGNRIPDDCDVLFEASDDCNDNQRPDECDVLDESTDCDGNLMPDECQADCNANGLTDICEILAGSQVDCDLDGRIDECEPPWETLTSLPAAWAQAPVLSSAFHDDTFVVAGSGRVVTVGRWTSDEWSQLGEFSMYPYGDYFDFGRSVVATKGYVFIGAPAEWYANSEAPGVVHALRRAGSNWFEELLVPRELHDHARFGWSLAAGHSGMVVVGSPSAPGGGAAYVFEFESGLWRQQELRPPQQVDGMQFGTSVAVWEPHVLVSQWVGAGERRASHVFRKRLGTWEYERSFSVDFDLGGTPLETRGAIAGNDVVLGVPRKLVSGVERGWAGTYSLLQLDSYPGYQFPVNPGQFRLGQSVSMQGDIVVLADDHVVRIFRTEVGELIQHALISAPGTKTVQTDGELILSGTKVVSLSPGDCNHNGIADSCETRAGMIADCNNNKVPDECDNLRPFDRGLDGDVDLLDFAQMQGCFTGPGGSLGVADCCRVFDGDGGDGAVDAADYTAFPSAMTGP